MLIFSQHRLKSTVILLLIPSALMMMGATCDTGDPFPDVETNIELTSTAFEDGTPMPVQFTTDGDDISPPLMWGELPEGTAELALIVDDLDSAGDTFFVHWVAYGIAAETTQLDQAIPADDAGDALGGGVQGINSFGNTGYGGPAPPEGDDAHRYRFRIYALDVSLQAAAGLSKSELLELMEGRILGIGELQGTFAR